MPVYKSAIIARGAGYVKFADGTMICTGVWVENITSIIYASPIYYAVATEQTFPAAFYANPSMSYCADRGEWMSACFLNISPTKFTLKHWLIASVSGFTLSTSWTAIGRWKA